MNLKLIGLIAAFCGIGLAQAGDFDKALKDLLK